MYNLQSNLEISCDKWFSCSELLSLDLCLATQICIATKIQCSGLYLDLSACSMCCSHLSDLLNFFVTLQHSAWIFEAGLQVLSFRNPVQYRIWEYVSVCLFYFKRSIKISQVDCGSFSVYLYLPLSSLKTLSFCFLQNNIKETDALILLFPTALQREYVSPKAML